MHKGLILKDVAPHSPAYRAGLRKGDRIIAINGEPVADELELRFFTAQSDLSMLYFRKSKLRQSGAVRRAGERFGVTVGRGPIRQCANRCVFCFVDQMPKGLRSSLYIKDEDYRYSFTNGNYVTLSRTPPSDLDRIVQLGLSPLYISVHATDPDVRSRLLGNPGAGEIMKHLRFLAKNDIRFHTQIVVCPGINDGRVLTKTISDLLSFGSALLSIAVVPVGLTRFRKAELAPVTGPVAAKLCRTVGAMSDAQAEKDGYRRIFCADELFINAGQPIPPKSYYEDYPQIENGVGLVRQLLEQWRGLKKGFAASKGAGRAGKIRQRPAVYALVTAVSASSYIQAIVREMERLIAGIEIQVKAAPNYFFGETVTVAGLLTAADVVKALGKTGGGYRCIFLPDAMFNANGFTMDGFSRQRIEKRIGTAVRVVSHFKQIVDYVNGK